jgi:hypothetical protein
MECQHTQFQTPTHILFHNKAILCYMAFTECVVWCTAPYNQLSLDIYILRWAMKHDHEEDNYRNRGSQVDAVPKHALHINVKNMCKIKIIQVEYNNYPTNLNYYR